MTNTDMEIRPTRTFKPWNEKIEVRLFGKPTDWSIASLNEEELKTPTQKGVAVFEQIHGIAASAKVGILYAPRPAEFNAVVCNHQDLHLSFSRNMEPMMEARLADNWDFSILRGINADGCDVPKGAGFWLSSADCPLLVLTNGEKVVCVHCGFRSLVNLPDNPKRPHYSVVDAAIEEFTKTGSLPSTLKAFVTLGIGHHFPSTKEEIMFVIEKEREIAGKFAEIELSPQEPLIDINRLVIDQCLNRGVDVLHDELDTCSDLGEDGQPLWWSYERAMALKDSTELCRNGVMVVHK